MLRTALFPSEEDSLLGANPHLSPPAEEGQTWSRNTREKMDILCRHQGLATSLGGFAGTRSALGSL